MFGYLLRLIFHEKITKIYNTFLFSYRQRRDDFTRKIFYYLSTTLLPTYVYLCRYYIILLLNVPIIAHKINDDEENFQKERETMKGKSMCNFMFFSLFFQQSETTRQNLAVIFEKLE